MKKIIIAFMIFVSGSAFAGTAEVIIGGMILGGAVVNEHHHHHYRRNQPVIVYQAPPVLQQQYIPQPYYDNPVQVYPTYPQVRCVTHPVIDVYGRIVAYQQICN